MRGWGSKNQHTPGGVSGVADFEGPMRLGFWRQICGVERYRNHDSGCCTNAQTRFSTWIADQNFSMDIGMVFAVEVFIRFLINFL